MNIKNAKHIRSITKTHCCGFASWYYSKQWVVYDGRGGFDSVDTGGSFYFGGGCDEEGFERCLDGLVLRLR